MRVTMTVTMMMMTMMTMLTTTRRALYYGTIVEIIFILNTSKYLQLIKITLSFYNKLYIIYWDEHQNEIVNHKCECNRWCISVPYKTTTENIGLHFQLLFFMCLEVNDFLSIQRDRKLQCKLIEFQMQQQTTLQY